MNKTADFCFSCFWGFQRVGAASKLGEQAPVKEACITAWTVRESAMPLFVLAALRYALGNNINFTDSSPWHKPVPTYYGLDSGSS